MSTNNKQSVQFAGRTLIVLATEPTLRTNLKVSGAHALVLEEIKEKMVTAAEFFFYTEVYPALVSCTIAEDGNPLPSADEVLDAKDVEGANAWYEAVRVNNLHLFPNAEAPADSSPESIKVEEREKKKEKT